MPKSKTENKSGLMEKIVSLCKRRGFVFPGSEIYGGLQGFYDFGPLGVEMKNNLKQLWWDWMTRKHEDIVGIDGAIITNPKVWEASGHLKSFVDPLVECKKCHHRFKADDISAECPDCGGNLTEPKVFNILVPTQLGVIEDEKTNAYLRGEACQTIYLDYKSVLDTTRLKIPFGICQIGKAFRNEVTPGNFLFRQREFEQWDLQWFCRPEEMEKWFKYWKNERMDWYKSIFTHPENLGFYEHEKLAHYAKKAFDIEYAASPIGNGKEMEGIHWRGDWDLSRHAEFSGQDLSYVDLETGEKFIPNIVATSGGVDRTFLFLLLDAYCEEKDRVVLKLYPKIAPYKVAVFPLLANKPELAKLARSIYDNLKINFITAWDDRGNIGKRYYAQDEIGTPFCVTVDFESLEDKKVTIRERDSMKQERIAIDELAEYIKKQLE